MLASAEQRQRYAAIRARHKPQLPHLTNLVMAFIVGGSICAVGQIFYNYLSGRGLPPDQAGAFTAVGVVVIGAVLTGVGLYDEIARVGGMGASLPISGFANSIVAPAMEYKREGWVLGVGAKMFMVAGPVIVYGVLTSMIAAGIFLAVHGQLSLQSWLGK
ncbi:MAG TPA: SpoVA/SpoVAEb family sporulation membrane protein [Bacillota bacterium]|nr:SpoVA/SpoVAEb family sporulation membrane protein [Bacillota bacterium]